MYPSLVDKLSGLWVQISAREVVISKPQLDHVLTVDPEGGRICCVILYVLYKNKRGHKRRAVSPVHKKKLFYNIFFSGFHNEGGTAAMQECSTVVSTCMILKNSFFGIYH